MSEVPPTDRHQGGHVLGIVYRCIATHRIKKAVFSRTTAQTGTVTLIQCFGSALNLNFHFAVHGCAGAAQLKTPYRDSTTHVIFEPLDFTARLPVLCAAARKARP